jgi:ABC-type dipeptide/oligopeptide/nickel transport system ATPase component
MTALALMRLLPEGGRVAAGDARLEEDDLFALTEAAMGEVRGRRLAMIFQEPQTSLNPVMTVAEQIGEALAAHRDLAGAAARAEAGRLLEAVGLATDRLDAYPFQLSGGQRQRALIAMMLAGDPEVLIADEPTTALDVTIQAQILRLLKDLQTQRGMGLLLITHDLDVARDMADRVAVMYAGQIVEWALGTRFTASRAIPTRKNSSPCCPAWTGAASAWTACRAGCPGRTRPSSAAVSPIAARRCSGVAGSRNPPFTRPRRAISCAAIWPSRH